jgi:hypothetical protein
MLTQRNSAPCLPVRDTRQLLAMPGVHPPPLLLLLLLLLLLFLLLLLLLLLLFPAKRVSFTSTSQPQSTRNESTAAAESLEPVNAGVLAG